MLDVARLNDMETALKTRDIPIAELCRRAGIEATTWWRWKTGKFYPSFSAAKAATDAFEGLIAAHPEPISEPSDSDQDAA